MDDHAPPLPAHEPPMALKVFAILAIVFGGMGLFCTPLALLMQALQVANFPGGEAFRNFSMISGIVWVPLSIALIFIGVGLWRQREIARQAAIVYAVVDVAVTVLFAIGQAWVAWTTLPADDPISMGMRMGAIMGSFSSLIIGNVFPILLLVFMLRQNVREACQRASATPSSPAPGVSHESA